MAASISENNTQSSNKRRKIKIKQKVFLPKWHDLSCNELHRKVSATARLLKGDQRNQFLGAKLRKDIIISIFLLGGG